MNREAGTSSAQRESLNRRREWLEAAVGGIAGLGTVTVMEAVGFNTEWSFVGGGIVFALAYNGIRKMREHRSESSS